MQISAIDETSFFEIKSDRERERWIISTFPLQIHSNDSQNFQPILWIVSRDFELRDSREITFRCIRNFSLHSRTSLDICPQTLIVPHSSTLHPHGDYFYPMMQSAWNRMNREIIFRFSLAKNNVFVTESSKRKELRMYCSCWDFHYILV